MKHKNTFLLLILVILFTNHLFSQQVTFEYLLNTEKDFNLFDILESENQNIYFSGMSYKPLSNKWNGILIKLNKSGQYLDSIHISNTSHSYLIENILPDSNNRFILNIMMSDTTQEHKHSSILIYKMDTNLTLLEHGKYDFPENYKSFVQILRKGLYNHLLITGTIKPPLSGHRMFLYVLNSDFDSLKAKIYLNQGSLFSYDVKELNNGNFWILRGINSNEAYIDSNLNMISKEKGIIPHFMDANYGLKWDTDSSFYLAADYFAGFNKGENNIQLNTQTINPIGSNDRNMNMTDHDIGFIRQYHPFDTTGYLFNSIGARDTLDFPASWGALDFKNKDSIFIGSSKNLDWGNFFYGTIPSWFRLIQTDSMLNIRWEHFYGGDAYYFMDKVIATQDGGCLMAGTRFDYINHPNLHKRDICIIKVNSEGLLTSTDGEPSPIVHNAIVYPNPGSNELRIRIAVQYTQSIFRLFDINGKSVLQQNISGKSVVINTAFLPTGTYIYKITGEKGLNESGKWVKK